MKLKNKTLLPPTSYQGGKQRLRANILDIIESREYKISFFHDICCGSGAVGLEAVSRGYKTHFVDIGPYGLFYQSISNNNFNIDYFEDRIENLPSIEGIQKFLTELSKTPVNHNTLVYDYLLLQSGAFGSKQIGIKDDRWVNTSFRSYWQPTETSSRRSVVNPMMPMPKTILDRVKVILEHKDNIIGHNISAEEYALNLTEEAVFYIDPPYKNTTKYNYTLDLYKVIKELQKKGNVYVSEGYKMEGATDTVLMSKARAKGNITGNVKKKAVEEYLNIFKKRG